MQEKATYFRRLLDGLRLQQSQLKKKKQKKVLSLKYTDKMYMDKPLNISRVYNKHQTCQVVIK